MNEEGLQTSINNLSLSLSHDTPNMIMLSKLVVVLVCMEVIVLVGGVMRVEGSSDPSKLVNECRTDIQQLGNCLMYATGKAGDPTKECCNTVNGIKERHPVCLCFFIQQAHNGSPTIKSLGVQESRLLQLPAACHLQNATLTVCPSLLGISPKSPDAAIFMNNNTSTSAASSTPSTIGSDNSSGFQHYGNAALLLGSLIVTLLVTIVPIRA